MASPLGPCVEGRISKCRGRLAANQAALVAIALLGFSGALSTTGPARVMAIGVLCLWAVEAIAGRIRLARVQFFARLPEVVEIDGAAPFELETRGGLTAALVALQPTHPFGGKSAIKGKAGRAMGTLSAADRGRAEQVTLTVIGTGLTDFAVSTGTLTFQPDRPVLLVPPRTELAGIDAFVDRLVGLGTTAELAGTRVFRDGDRPGDVHWSSSARASELIVRDRPASLHEPREVIIAVGAAVPGQLSALLSVARDLIERLIARGVKPRLLTMEGGPTGPRRKDDVIVDQRALFERLADAQPAPLPVDLPTGAIVIDINFRPLDLVPAT